MSERLRTAMSCALGISIGTLPARRSAQMPHRLAPFSPEAFGSPLLLFVEPPCGSGSSGFLTDKRRAKCHIPKFTFLPITPGTLAVTLRCRSWHTEETGIAASDMVNVEHEDDPCGL